MSQKWQLILQDPSGEIRRIPVTGPTTIGRNPSSGIYLKDPTAPFTAAHLFPDSNSTSYWIKVPEQSPPLTLGEIEIREAQVPPNVPLRIGETQLQLEIISESPLLPQFPPGVKPWFTCSDEGKKVLWTAKKAASTPLSIYIAGETGTGKEVLSHLIHAWSDRKSGPFVPLHCGALPVSLAESELFGHVKGAFTGALHHRPGALMQAHGGTLFLDEIGDLPLDIQVKLLRFLENGEIKAVGSDRPSHADVRIVCATHRPLQQLVREGKFRQDLFFRLASVTISIPSLRSRPEDIELLVRKFSKELNRSLSHRAMLRLLAHSWPGNVRELQHAINRACGMSGAFSPVLDEESFEFLLSPEPILESPNPELGCSMLTLHEMERVLLLKALKLSQGNRTQAAKIMGVARSTLFEMLKRHKIQGPRTVEFRAA